MEEELTPSGEGEVCPVSPIYRTGDTIVFKYEGNVRRATSCWAGSSG